MLTKPLVIDKGSFIGTHIQTHKKQKNSLPYRLEIGSKYYPIARITSEKKSGMTIKRGRSLFMPHLDNKYMAALYENKSIDQLISYIYLTYEDLQYHIYRQYKGPRDPLFNGLFTLTGACHFPEIRDIFEKLYLKTLIDTLIKFRDKTLPIWKKKKSDIITFITQSIPRIFYTAFIDNMRGENRFQRSFDTGMDIVDNSNVVSEYVEDNLLIYHILEKAKPA